MWGWGVQLKKSTSICNTLTDNIPQKIHLADNIVEFWWKADGYNEREGVCLVSRVVDPKNVLVGRERDSL